MDVRSLAPRPDTRIRKQKARSAETKPRAARFPGWVTLGLVLVAYLVVLSIATYPALALFRTHLPSLCDPLHHLWVMKWYSSCLLEGRSPVLCPALEYPIGVSLGQFATLHLQSLVYLVASRSLDQEAGRYNLVWVAGFLSTGLGTFVLIWYVLRHRVCAAFGGMLAMLSTPMMGHALGHLDLLYVGGVALFLVAWLRFVDRPGWGRLAAAVALYSLVAMSASYYMVMSTVPATLYLAWCWWREGPGPPGRVAPGTRVGWLLGFAALTVLALVVVLWPQVRLMGQARHRRGPGPSSTSSASRSGAMSRRRLATGSAGSCHSAPGRTGSASSATPTSGW